MNSKDKEGTFDATDPSHAGLASPPQDRLMATRGKDRRHRKSVLIDDVAAVLSREKSATIREDAADKRENIAHLREDAAHLREDAAQAREGEVHLREGEATSREHEIRAGKATLTATDHHIMQMRQANEKRR